jgi:energy-coupling factor transporter ATP-binding protein EcfA2
MIEIHELTYTYPERNRPALRSVNLTVPAGTLNLLVGSSGSGKSTLLRAINGLVPHFYGGHFAGRVVAAGLDTRQSKPLDLAGAVGTVFQEPEHRFVTTRVADEIAFALELAGVDAGDIKRRLDEVVDRLCLGPLMNRDLHTLSGGELQRVAVGAALGRRPKILVLDEPTSQLDALSSEATLEWLQELRRSLGLTTLIAEHRYERALGAADEIACLSSGGSLVAHGRESEIAGWLHAGRPLYEAARRLSLPLPVDPAAVAKLRQRVLGLPPSDNGHDPAGPWRLEAQGLSHAYNGLEALHEVGLRVPAGGVLAVLGRNGSGKTTLLRCLMGLLSPGIGRVQVDGKAMRGLPVSSVAQHMAYVPQWPSALLFADSVRDELAFTLRNHGLEDQPPVGPEELLEAFGLTSVAGKYPRDLSSGERQRTALAAVLVTRPGVLLLDEPTLGMDPAAQRRFSELLASWRQSGLAVVLATHDVEFAAANSDQALVLDQGQVVAEGMTPEVLFGRAELHTALQRLTGRARPASVQDLPLQPPGGLPATL